MKYKFMAVASITILRFVIAGNIFACIPVPSPPTSYVLTIGSADDGSGTTSG